MHRLTYSLHHQAKTCTQVVILYTAWPISCTKIACIIIRLSHKYHATNFHTTSMPCGRPLGSFRRDLYAGGKSSASPQPQNYKDHFVSFFMMQAIEIIKLQHFRKRNGWRNGCFAHHFSVFHAVNITLIHRTICVECAVNRRYNHSIPYGDCQHVYPRTQGLA